MAIRAALPAEAVTITPGYSWRLDLDVLFDGERPNDWPEWNVRVHIWGDGVAFTLVPGSGVRFDEVDGLDGEEGPHVIPIIEMTAQQTEALRTGGNFKYLIDMTPPGGVAEDYFSGPVKVLYAPPSELLA